MKTIEIGVSARVYRLVQRLTADGWAVYLDDRQRTPTPFCGILTTDGLFVAERAGCVVSGDLATMEALLHIGLVA